MKFRLNWGAECCLVNPGGIPGQAGESQSWCAWTGVPSRRQSCFQVSHITEREDCKRQGRRNSKLSLRFPTVIGVLGDIMKDRPRMRRTTFACWKNGEKYFFSENALEKKIPQESDVKKKYKIWWTR